MDARSNTLYGAGDLAQEFGITPRALRFYEAKGLLTPRRAGARRVYDYRDRARLELILRGKRLGFSLATVGEYLDLYDRDTSQANQLQQLHAAVSSRITDLEQQREALERALAELNLIRDQTLLAMRERDIPLDPDAATGADHDPSTHSGDDPS